MIKDKLEDIPIGFIGTFRNGKCKIYREIDPYIDNFSEYHDGEVFSELSEDKKILFLSESLNQIYNYPRMFNDLKIKLVYKIDDSNIDEINYIESLNKVKYTCYNHKNYGMGIVI